MFGLAVWLTVGALTARLFGAFVSGGRRPWERGEDERRRTVKSSAVSGETNRKHNLCWASVVGAFVTVGCEQP